MSQYNVSNVWTIHRQIKGILKSKGWLVCSSSVIVANTSLILSVTFNLSLSSWLVVDQV